MRLAPVRAQAASSLAKHGDPGGLSPGAAIGIDDTEDEWTRSLALNAFSLFRGASLKRFLLELLESRPAAAPIRSTAYSALRWYVDQEALRALVGAFRDEDRYVRWTAVVALRRQRSDYTARFLRDTLPALGPTSRVYAARALQQLERAPHIDVFRDFLASAADSIDDYAAIGQAVRGLRDAYLYLPVAEAASALRDPRHVIRLAGTLALLEHSDRAGGAKLVRQLASGDDATTRSAALRAMWAAGLADRAKDVVERARAAYESGNVIGASRIIQRAFLYHVRYRDVLGAGLSPWFHQWTSPSIDLRGLLQVQLSLYEGSGPAAIRTLEPKIRENPSLLETILNDPAFDRLRETYYFQVHLGLREPLLVEDIELPEIPGRDMEEETTT